MVERASEEKLRAACNPDELGFMHTDELGPLKGIIGQDRAVKALHFGLEIRNKGFNLYVAGEPGTGKNTAVMSFLTELAQPKEPASDWCYVNCFKDNYSPRALRFPPGRAAGFAREMKDFVEAVRQEIKVVFESEEYTKRRSQTLENIGEQKARLLGALNDKAEQEGFVLQTTPVGFYIVPVIDGQPVKEANYLELPEENKQAITARREQVESEINTTLQQLQVLERTARDRMEGLDREVARYVLSNLISQLQSSYEDLVDVQHYLEEVKTDILDNLSVFKGEKGDGGDGPSAQSTKDYSRRYSVNVLVDNGESQGAAVVFEESPLYNRLVGRIEREACYGTLVTDFTMIRAGSLHRANGGYLTLPVHELLSSPFAWESLKRALREGKITIDEPTDRLGILSTKSMQPEPIPLDVKVILMGDPGLYQVLYALDAEFQELFKVKVEFDTRMDRTPDNIQSYGLFAAALCRKEDLRHLDAKAVARLVEHGSRLTADQEKLSTRFADLADIVREANYYAGVGGETQISKKHIAEAIAQRLYRSNLPQERMADLTREETLLIDVDGVITGQVNALSVFSLGEMAFGRPTRITAVVGCGRGGLIDIERESRLGGRFHTKGVMILGGFLADRFAQLNAINISARLVFEQSYGEVDGDSASSAELYALLSALSGFGIRQGLAVTGSVNQKGGVQAIGGVNEKVEGFFDTCSIKGLTGDQGVLIPYSNLRHLVLRDDVVEAARNGLFHIYPVRTIDEGIEVLTGVPAGRRLDDGRFEAGTVNAAVEARLELLSKGSGHNPEEAPSKECGHGRG
ncbi:MAG: AAA family ATPase [Candidatus Desulforudis sp.]|nr:AAA family ATPase [Desulforudis sp.]